MGLDLTTEDWENLKKIKDFIKKEWTDIAPPLMWKEVGQTILKAVEWYKEIKVYVIEIEIIEKDHEGKEEKRESRIIEFIYDGKPRTLATVMEEERQQSRRKKKSTYEKY